MGSIGNAVQFEARL